MLDENMKNRDDLYVVNIETCTATKLSEVKEITDDMIIISDEDKIIEAAQLIADYQSVSVEINYSPIRFPDSLEEISEESPIKPNPIYIPKHIARRKRGRK
jgi:hypothetical protein